MWCLSKSQKYKGYTLLEMLVVMSILMIFMGMSFSAFGGLQNTIKMNEYTLTLEQNIVNIQRAAMLLERGTDENWIYGLGIDFSDIRTDGKYRAFKWCSPFEDYGDISTKSYIPGYDPSYPVGATLSFGTNGYLPATSSSIYSSSLCNDVGESSLVGLSGYETSLTPPSGAITLDTYNGKEVQYVLFESVSGRTFFYDSDGKIINYDLSGNPIADSLDWEVIIDPTSGGNTKSIVIDNLSGRVTSSNVE